ncbi:DNA damage-regulated autophagy modulator protein 1-like [Dendropsophus ebraccatus]|uniref:DNA damage-regulated autophagy modulator protein 1-like n=1 Tax=Dendropsophus ebraccatus TaxID=150705 RepID=UPI003831CF88
MEVRGLAIVPVIWVIWNLWGLYVLLLLTVLSGHNRRPFISDTGIQPPESVIYTAVFLVSSILGPGVAFLHYSFMIHRSEPSEKRFIIVQRILLTVGWIVCIANSVNAFFSMRSNPTAHRIGAGTAFVGMATHNLCQAVCLYGRSYSSRWMCHVRLAGALVTTVILVLLAVGMASFNAELCTGRCAEIFYLPVLLCEYLGFCGLMVQQLTSYADFQSLTLRVSRDGISISLREKTPDPETPA